MVRRPIRPPFYQHSAERPISTQDTPQRYARGEIDTPTFEHMREQLESSGTRSYQQSDGNQSVISGR